MSQSNKGLPSQQSCTHIEMTVLESTLYGIWECARAGYEAAKTFVKLDLRIMCASVRLSFNDGKVITYERYCKIRNTMQNVIRRCIHDKSLHQGVLHD